MNAYPLGNDLIVKWNLLYSDDFIFPLMNYDYKLSYRTNRGTKVVTDLTLVTVEENLLTWRFTGDQQVVSGRYTLCLEIMLHGSKVIELQYDNAFALSPIAHKMGVDSEVNITSYCDAIDIKDAVLQSRHSLDLAAEATRKSSNALTNSEVAKTTSEEAKALAETSKGNSDEALEKASTAETSASNAEQSARNAEGYLNQLNQAISQLPDGQAVTVKVAEHTTKLSELENNKADRSLVIDTEIIPYEETLNKESPFFVEDKLIWTVNGVWKNAGVASPYREGIQIYHIPANAIVEITANASRDASYRMLKTIDDIVIDGIPNDVEGHENEPNITANTTARIPTINTEYYLAIRGYSLSTVKYLPASMRIFGEIVNEKNRITENFIKITTLEDKVFGKSRYYHGSWGLKPFEFDKGYYESGQTSVKDDLSIVVETGSSGIRECANTYEEVLSWMDALMSIENVSNTTITKKSIGTSSDNRTIYEYVFTNKRYSADGMPQRQNPIILVDACIHGFEKMSFFAWYAFLKDMLTSTDNEFLNAISRNIEIHFIPCVNPYGFDNNSYLNANGVNINRNFDTDNWIYVPSGSDASGEEPFDQPESQAIRDWVNSYTNAMMLFTSHANGRVTNEYIEMNTCICPFGIDEYHDRLANVFRRHIEIQTQAIPKIYNLNIGNSFCGKYQYSGTAGAEDDWCTQKTNTLSMTLEMFNQLRVSGTFVFGAFTNTTIKCCAEICGNILGQFLAEYAE